MPRQGSSLLRLIRGLSHLALCHQLLSDIKPLPLSVSHSRQLTLASFWLKALLAMRLCYLWVSVFPAHCALKWPMNASYPPFSSLRPLTGRERGMGNGSDYQGIGMGPGGRHPKLWLTAPGRRRTQRLPSGAMDSAKCNRRQVR